MRNRSFVPAALALVLCYFCLSPIYYSQKAASVTTKTKALTALTTIVTAYFHVPSKHSFTEYEEWMANTLSVNDAMVIYTEPSLVSTMERLRAHAIDLTCIVPMELSDTHIARSYSNDFWERQLSIDPEKKIHQSYQLFWIWLSKSWFVHETIHSNPFKSDLFVWSDIGSFRTTEYNNKTVVRHPEVVPQSAILVMAAYPPERANTPWIQKGKDPTWVAGAHVAGRINAWNSFHEAFQKTLLGYVEQDLFVGEDQALIQSTCIQHPTLCAVVTPDLVKGDVWFGLQDVLHRRGDVFSTETLMELTLKTHTDFEIPRLSP